MKKIYLITFMVLAGIALPYTSAFDIDWGNQATYSNLQSNTLRKWAEGIDGRIGGATAGTGNIYYVDSNVAVEGDGTSWVNAKNTLDEAINLCTDSNGDVIYVAQGHNESWSTTDSADLDVIGVTIIGCGSGTLRPTFDFDDTDPELVIAAADCYVYNLIFNPSVTGVVHAIEIEADADGSVIDSCWFKNGEASGTDEFVDAIQPAALADNIAVTNCRFESWGGAGANTGIDLTAGVNIGLVITGNYFSGDYAEAPIYSDNDIHLRAFISQNTCYNTNSGEYGIEFGGAATGVLSFNSVYTDALATAIDPGSLACVENYAINTTDLSSVRVPVDPAISAQTQTAGSAWDILAKMYYTADGTGAYPATLANDSLFAMIMTKGATATPSTYSNTTDSLEAIADHVQTLITTAAGTDVYPSGITNDSIFAKVLSKAEPPAASSFNNTTDSLEAISDLVTTADTAIDTGYAIQEKCISKTVSTIANGANNLFAVANGPIKILDIVTYVTTTAIGAEGCLVGYNVDPTTPATDTAFGTDGTALECNNAAVGTALIWDGVLAADLTTAVNGAFVGMGRDVADGLIVPPGMIELTAAHDGEITGEFTVYMRYIPLAANVTVTAQ